MANKKNNKEKIKKTDIKNKREKSKIVNNNDTFNSEVYRVVIVAGIIIVIFCVFYWITWLVTGGNKAKDDSSDSVVTNISYDNIILGRSFSMTSGEYLVLYYDKTDSSIASTYSSLVSTYKNSSSALELYVVNMGDAINKRNASDTANYEAKEASELAINGPTLIKFSGGLIADYIEGEEAITNYLS